MWELILKEEETQRRRILERENIREEEPQKWHGGGLELVKLFLKETIPAVKSYTTKQCRPEPESPDCIRTIPASQLSG